MSYTKRMILGKAEVTYGVDPTLEAADAVLAGNLSLLHLEGDYQERSHATGQAGAQVERLYNAHAGARFELEAASSGTAGTAPELGHFLKACGLSETVAAGTSVSYSPTDPDAAHASVALALHSAKTIQTVLGCRGALSFSAEVNRKALFTFDLRGAYGAPSTPGAVTGDYSSWREGLECNAANMNAFTFGGEALCVRSFSVTDGRTPRRGRFMNCEQTDIRARRFTGRMTVEMPARADLDVIAIAKAGTTSPLVWQLGSVAGDIVRIAGPAVQIKYAGEQDIDGTLGVNLDLVFTPDQGDDEIAFIFQ